jgi:serine/threonine protein phosphatase PrpC
VSQVLTQGPAVPRESQITAPLSRKSHVAATHPPRVQVEAFGHSHIGLLREGNEDCFAVLAHLGLYMVADGMGGAAAGEVASRMVLDSVQEAFENVEMTWPAAAGESTDRKPSTALLIAGIQRAHSLIGSLSRHHADMQGMGTTFAGILVVDDGLVIAHIGDSRVYRLRGQRLDLLTEDHSMLNEYIRRGLWNPAEADLFPARNVITRAVGVDNLDVDTRLEVPEPGDVYLICSDGLHGMVDEREITSVLLKHEDLTLAASRLIDLANDYGGHDNITTVLVRVTAAGAR